MGAAEYTIYGSTDLERLQSTGSWLGYSSSSRTFWLLLGEDGSLGEPVILATWIARDKPGEYAWMYSQASKPSNIYTKQSNPWHSSMQKLLEYISYHGIAV